MNTNRRLFFSLLAILFLVVTTFTSGTSHARTVTPVGDLAEWLDETGLYDAYVDDRICFSPIEGDSATNGYVPIVDNFRIEGVTFDTMNAGTTSIGFTPCVPEACPEGFYGPFSGNACHLSDPFAGNVMSERPTSFGEPDRPSAINAPATVESTVERSSTYGMEGYLAFSDARDG